MLTDVQRSTFYTYDSVADLTSADIPQNAQNAQYVTTLGYYDANDGGGADYRIVAQSFPDVRSLKLKDGRFANILTDVGNIRQFGCKSGGTEDCAPTINSLLKIYSDVYIPDGTYSISTSIVLPGPNQLLRGTVLIQYEDSCLAGCSCSICSCKAESRLLNSQISFIQCDIEDLYV